MGCVVVSIEPLNETITGHLKKSGIDIKVIGRPSDMMESLENLQPEVLVCRDRDNIATIVERCPSIKMLFTVEVGVEEMPFEKLIEKGIRLANTSGISADIMSNYAMSCILCSASRLKESICNQQKAYWKKYQCTDSLTGKTLLIVGAGRTGSMIAKKARNFGLRIIGVQRTSRKCGLFDQIGTLNNLPEFLGQSDYIVCTIPLTPATQYLFSAYLFGKMKEDAVFINISRGGILNESDLISALNNGRIKEAYLDVFSVEPLPVNHAFWSHPDIIVTPHQSGRLENYMEKAMDIFICNYHAYIEGVTMPNEVNLQQGY
ncbi:MAG: D-2-hydroxyacid dehydrogenase [Prevotella sp.]|nr:D-2-hydroxyacid dehydrogenase [Prevotella sp.]